MLALGIRSSADTLNNITLKVAGRFVLRDRLGRNKSG